MDDLLGKNDHPRPSPFRGRWLPLTILVMLLVALFLRLGTWQLARRAERLASNAEILARTELPALTVTGELLDPEEANLRRATARGVFDYSQETVLRNRTWNGYPGVHLLVPLQLVGSDTAILVDRGWIPYESAAPESRKEFQNAQGEVEVRGILRQSQERRGPVSPEDPMPSSEQRVDAWHRVDLPKIRQQLRYPLQTLYLEEDVAPGETARVFPKPLPEINLDEGSHLFYAIQWFAFAAIAAGGYIALYRQQTGRRGETRGEQTT
jgi:surfeit locus 1 family protein